jgi:hypothetical protein
MNQNFGDWYRIAGIEPNDELLHRRWTGAAEFAADPSIVDILSLVGIFCKLPHAEETEQSFRQAFRAVDTAFSMRGSDVELSCLAGATLAEIIESCSADLADVAGLALVCSDFRGLRRTALLPEIVEMAEEYLAERSGQLRTDTTVPELPHLSVGEELPSIVTSLNTIGDAVRALGIDRQLRAEESDILWWLLAEYSRDLETPLRRAPWPAAAIHVGKELGDIIRILPGPYPMRAFLSRALSAATTPTRSRRAVRLCEAVAGVDQAKCRLPVLNSDLAPHCPVLKALAEFREYGPSDHWLTTFGAATGIRAEVEVSPLDLALQSCRELLLERATRDLRA